TWLQERFDAAGLEPPSPGQWRHRYTLPGVQLDSRKVQLNVTIGSGAAPKKLPLTGHADVRVLAAPAGGARGEATAAAAAGAETIRGWRGRCAWAVAAAPPCSRCRPTIRCGRRASASARS